VAIQNPQAEPGAGNNSKQALAQNAIDLTSQQPLNQAPHADAAALVGLLEDPNFV
jgi:hypothetical protein